MEEEGTTSSNVSYGVQNTLTRTQVASIRGGDDKGRERESSRTRSTTAEHNTYLTLLVNCLEMLYGLRPYKLQLKAQARSTSQP